MKKNDVKVYENNAGLLFMVVKGEDWTGLCDYSSFFDLLDVLDEARRWSADDIESPDLCTAAGDDVASALAEVEADCSLIWDNGKYDLSAAGVAGEEMLLRWIACNMDRSVAFVKATDDLLMIDNLLAFAEVVRHDWRDWSAADAPAVFALLDGVAKGDIAASIGQVHQAGVELGLWGEAYLGEQDLLTFCDVTHKAIFEEWASLRLEFVEEDGETYWYKLKK